MGRLGGFRYREITKRLKMLGFEFHLHHSDPFDRLLIAQAIAEPLRLLTVDAALSQYSDVVMLI